MGRVRATRSKVISPEVLANERFGHCAFCGEPVRHSGEERDVWRHVYRDSPTYQFYTYCKETSLTLAEPEFYQVRLV